MQAHPSPLYDMFFSFDLHVMHFAFQTKDRPALVDSKELPCTVIGRNLDPFTLVVICYKLEGG